jgi:hypothetical protein
VVESGGTPSGNALLRRFGDRYVGVIAGDPAPAALASAAQSAKIIGVCNDARAEQKNRAAKSCHSRVIHRRAA